MDKGESITSVWQVIYKILDIVAGQMGEWRVDADLYSAGALGITRAYRENVLELMLEGGLIEGRLDYGASGEEPRVRGLRITLEGMECAVWIKENILKK